MLNRNERARKTTLRQSMIRQSSTAPFALMHEIRKLEHLQEQLGEEATKALEVLQKEVACHRLGNQDAAQTIAKLQAEIREMRTVKPSTMLKDAGDVIAPNKSVSANLKEEITRLHSQGSTIANLEEQLESVQKSIDKLVMSLPSNINALQQANAGDETPKTKNHHHHHHSKKKKLLPLTPSSVSNRQNFLKSPCSPLSASRQVLDCDAENKAPQENNNSGTRGTTTPQGSEKETPQKGEESGDVSSRESTPGYRRSSSVNMKKMQQMFQNAAEENVRSIRAYVTELKERVAKLQYQKQLLVCQVSQRIQTLSFSPLYPKENLIIYINLCQVLELEANEGAGYSVENEENTIEEDEEQSQVAWHITFIEERQQIIELWHVCHVSIIHRTQFYLLFKGDQADQIYMEVELRRLTWLEEHLAEVGNATPARIGEEPAVVSLSSR